MEEQRRPRAREKRVSTEGKGVKKQGEGLGTGPLNNTGNYADRGRSESKQPSSTGPASPQRPQQARQASSQSKPAAAPQGTGRQAGNGNSVPPQRPAATQGNPFSAPHSSGNRAGSGNSIPPQRPTGAQSNPFAAPHSSGNRTGAGQGKQAARPAAAPQHQQRSSTVPTGANGNSGCGTKLLPLVLVLALLLGGGRLTGLFGGQESDTSSGTGTIATTQTAGTSQTTSYSQSTGTSQTVGTASQSSVGTAATEAGGLSNLLSSFLTSSGSSLYDFTGSGLSLSGSGSSAASLLSGSPAGASASTAGKVDTTVNSAARAKYTTLKGNKQDTVTLMVYMCGTDLESQSGMGTSDLKEMAAATLGENVNLIVYTGGCSRWKNNVVSNSVHQIYQIRDGGLYCLEKNMGSAAMTSPATLTKFIQYGAEHFPANRMCLIFWDHGGGSVSGFGYDELNKAAGSMSLAGIHTALKDGGVKFDFVGFDACLMATVETGLMLSQYADYMIASEESEPGVGWYYTNWLTSLGANPSLSTLEIGRQIADDFVEVCNRQCRGQATTLSVVDLAELSATVPGALKDFSADTSGLIQNNEYNKVSSARSRTREFAQSSRIDQVDLVHFARNLATEEGERLASALESSVKYNRTGGGMTNAYGLSIYFPYQRAAKVSQVVSTYNAIGMEEEYTRCIQAFASLEASGQLASGTPVSSYTSSGYGAGYNSTGSSLPGLMDVLMGGTTGTSGYAGSGYSGYGSSDLADLLGGLFSDGSGASGGSLFDLFGRSLNTEAAAAYIAGHHLDASALIWDGNRMHLSEDQWAEIAEIALNVFVDDGEGGFIDLGMDNVFDLDGNDLVADFDGTWISLDGQPMAYYYLGTVENGEEEYVISGYAPALLNGTRVNLLLNFDHERPYGYIAGAAPVYADGETEAQAKNLIQIGAGDQIQFICDYYDYEGNYQDSYRLGEPLLLGDSVEIANTPIGDSRIVATYCLTDLYQQHWWTPEIKN